MVGATSERSLLLETADDCLTATFEALILCTGARELLLPFPGWALPGVTGAGGLQALIKAGYDIRGERAVVAGSGPLLLATAQLAARVERIVEQAARSPLARFAANLWRWPSKVARGVALASPRYRWASHITEALGDHRLEAVRVRDGRGREQTLRCGRFACGYGLVPNRTRRAAGLRIAGRRHRRRRSPSHVAARTASLESGCHKRIDAPPQMTIASGPMGLASHRADAVVDRCSPPRGCNSLCRNPHRSRSNRSRLF